MLTVKTWCLPKLSEEQLTELHNAIVAAVASVENARVRDESDMLNLFPADQMQYGLGQEIKIEISDVHCSLDEDDRNQLAKKVGEAVKSFFLGANIFCVVRKTNPEDGVWSS